MPKSVKALGANVIVNSSQGAYGSVEKKGAVAGMNYRTHPDMG
jgi:hypothetical protein